jgi:hypothetical protein
MTNEELLTQLTKRIDVAEQRVMHLVESHSQELQTLGHQTNSRLDAIQARLDRQGGLLRNRPYERLGRAD